MAGLMVDAHEYGMEAYECRGPLVPMEYIFRLR
jgi:hypothetical protein